MIILDQLLDFNQTKMTHRKTFWKETLLDQTPVDTLRAFKVFETAEQ